MEAQPHLYENIVITGGCCGFAGIRDRVESDVRTLAPDEFDVNVVLPSK
jgi:Actin and related proteins